MPQNNTKAVYPTWFKAEKVKNLMQWALNEATPKEITPPTNKIISGDINFRYDTPNLGGKHPLKSLGFSHVGDFSVLPFHSALTPQQKFKLIGESEWLNNNAPSDTSQWYVQQVVNQAQSYKVFSLNFEGSDGSLYFHYTTDGEQKMQQIASQTKAIGATPMIWARGLCDPIQGLKNGQNYENSTTSAQQAVDALNDINLFNYTWNGYVLNTGMESNQSWYRIGVDPTQMYRQILAIEYARLKRPTVKHIPSIWQTTETVDGNPLTPYRFKRVGQPDVNFYEKPPSPVSSYMADVLFSLFVADGFYHFESFSANASEDPAHYVDLTTWNNGLAQSITVNGSSIKPWYKLENYSHNDYLFLCLYWLSQEPYKEILELNTPVISPDYQVSGSILRNLDNKRTPFALLNQEPLIRVKYNANNTKAIILAYNPYNLGNQSVRVIDNVTGLDTTINLVMGYPLLTSVNL